MAAEYVYAVSLSSLLLKRSCSQRLCWNCALWVVDILVCGRIPHCWCMRRCSGMELCDGLQRRPAGHLQVRPHSWSIATLLTQYYHRLPSGHLWTAKWWTQNETPGGECFSSDPTHAAFIYVSISAAGASGVWTDDGACTSSKREALAEPARPLQNSRFFRF